MTNGNYYMDGECFIHVKDHLLGMGDTPMITAEMLKFSNGSLAYCEHICLVEEACDRRMVPSSKEEFDMVTNLFQSCHEAIDTLNTLWLMPRWKERQKSNS